MTLDIKYIKAIIKFPSRDVAVEGELRYGNAVPDYTRGWQICFKTSRLFGDDKYHVKRMSGNEFELVHTIWYEGEESDRIVAYTLDLNQLLNQRFPASFYKCHECGHGIPASDKILQVIKSELPEVAFEVCTCRRERLADRTL